jgi:hypothetical protein
MALVELSMDELNAGEATQGGMVSAFNLQRSLRYAGRICPLEISRASCRLDRDREINPELRFQ